MSKPGPVSRKYGRTLDMVCTGRGAHPTTALATLVFSPGEAIPIYLSPPSETGSERWKHVRDTWIEHDQLILDCTRCRPETRRPKRSYPRREFMVYLEAMDPGTFARVDISKAATLT